MIWEGVGLCLQTTQDWEATDHTGKRGIPIPYQLSRYVCPSERLPVPESQIGQLVQNRK